MCVQYRAARLSTGTPDLIGTVQEIPHRIEQTVYVSHADQAGMPAEHEIEQRTATMSAARYVNELFHRCAIRARSLKISWYIRPHSIQSPEKDVLCQSIVKTPPTSAQRRASLSVVFFPASGESF